MKRQIFICILPVLLLLAGCNKIDLDDPVDGTPVFRAAFTANGFPKLIEAGAEGYYMFTEYERGADGVYVFTGRLQQTDSCGNTCGDVLTIRIRDFQQVLQGLPIVEEALKPGDYLFQTQSVTDTQWVYDTTFLYAVQFDASGSVTPPGVSLYSWSFGGSPFGQGVNASFVFDDLSQPVPATLSIASNNLNCSSTQTRLVQKNAGGAVPCSVMVTAAQDSTFNSLINLTAAPQGTPPFTYAWTTGDSTDQISFFTNPASLNTAGVTLTDANGCTSQASLSFVNLQGTTFNYCSASFSYDVQELLQVDSTEVVDPGDSLQFSKVTIEYQPAGSSQRYRSDLAEQPGNAFFTILSVENYDDNEQGQRTKKLKIAFGCQLKNQAGEVIMLSNGEAVIGVAYP